jgi:NodT family efflux transporter outer membrane factor (OMF) lipoprotein
MGILKQLVTSVLAAFLLGACAATPLPELPAEDVPSTWQKSTSSTDAWPNSDWWNNFQSAELNDVIALVEQKNFDLQNNERNLRLAQLALRDAGFDLLPTPVVDFGASTNYFGSKIADGDYTDGSSESFNLGAGFVYSDILSKPAEYDAAKARYESTLALLADTRLNTLGTAASTYFRILLLRDRIEAAQQNVENAEAIARIVTARVNAGTVNQVNLLQQQIAVQRERNNLSSLIQDEYAARAALALLVADSVQDFNVSATTLQDVLVPEIQPGLPSSLLHRRPDIVQAEAGLKLSRADVDLARLAYLPDISLTGSVRLASDSLGDLLGDGSTTVSATAGLVQLIFDNGSRGRNVERRRLELESALANYRETVIAAFNDIDVSLGNIELLRALGDVATEDLKRAEESFRIAEARYREGVDDYQTVLISQNQLFDTRNAYFDNKLAQLNAAIAFYQSLGGGWQIEDQVQ